MIYLSGYIDFGQNHPFNTHNNFLHAFFFGCNSKIEDPSPPKVRLLQNFLQACTIARPASILNSIERNILYLFIGTSRGLRIVRTDILRSVECQK
jgi:hypothetical protein